MVNTPLGVRTIKWLKVKGKLTHRNYELFTNEIRTQWRTIIEGVDLFGKLIMQAWIDRLEFMLE